jgi:tetratricopeptide (TPR) repeat protein
MSHVGAEALFDLVLSLTGDRRRDFLHLLVCPRCRRAFDPELVSSPAPEPEAGEDDPLGRAAIAMETIWRRARAVDERAETMLRRDEAAVSGLLEELLSEPEGEGLLALLEQARFQSPGLARRLLRESAAVRDRDAGRARTLAVMALAVVGGADQERFPRALLDGLRLQAGCHLAEAAAVQGRLGEAEAWLVTAQVCVEDYPGDALERAFLCRSMGLVRRRECRTDEALALLARAVEVFAGYGEEKELAVAQVEEAWIHYDGHDPARALLLFRQALELLPAGERPAAHLRGLGGLVLCLADLGREEELVAALAEGMALARRVPLVPDGQRFEAMRARAAELLGGIAEAAGVLESLFGRLREEGCVFEAAAVGLELARLYLRQGRAAAFRGVLKDLGPLPEEARQAVLTARELLARGDPDAEVALRLVQEDLSYARHDPGFRFGVAFQGVPLEARIELVPPLPKKGPWIRLSAGELVSDRDPDEETPLRKRSRHAAPSPEARVYILNVHPWGRGDGGSDAAWKGASN